MSTFVHDLIDPSGNWCPDCGLPRGVCTCDPEQPFIGHWDWWEDEDDLDDEWDADDEYSYRDYDGEWGIDE